MSLELDSKPTAIRRGRQLARVRFAMGQAQMGAAIVAAVLLLQTGTSTATLVATSVATLLTATSVFVFRILPRRRKSA